MRVAVTGAGGRLGSALITALADSPFTGPAGPIAWQRDAFDLDAPDAIGAADAGAISDDSGAITDDQYVTQLAGLLDEIDGSQMRPDQFEILNGQRRQESIG
jgi:nucleoside-diphosphate-sugar epimerase